MNIHYVLNVKEMMDEVHSIYINHTYSKDRVAMTMAAKYSSATLKLEHGCGVAVFISWGLG